ncbi:hypothetical protein SAMN05216267_102474 [Actinacidiphila rubida]|uniref:Uncharacterized protein n=1 Tax=Actinacidiphila rubida TaxID=310780 RepID=A0A1H8P2Q6_9ACTN|nr:hypothetical protein [Actinacidiphila rubida]SEO36145.1 hypothetical protein SAMN05216267_102474 [Actinacidiphila rubida]
MSTGDPPARPPAAVPPMPSTPPATGRRRQWRLGTWQTVIAAVIGAAGAIAAAVVPLLASSTSGPSPGPLPPSPVISSPSDHPAVAISTVSQAPLANGAVEYTFTGTSAHTDPATMMIFVIARNPRPAALGGTWLVSPAATVEGDGDWSVSWKVASLPAQVKWIATIYGSYDSSCSAGGECATSPPVVCPSDCVNPSSAPAAAPAPSSPADELARLGPDAGSSDDTVIATSAPHGP